MVINLAPVSLSNKKVNFYTCPRLTFLKKNATENAYKSISKPLDFKPPQRLASLALEICLRLVLKSGCGPERKPATQPQLGFILTLVFLDDVAFIGSNKYCHYFPFSDNQKTGEQREREAELIEQLVLVVNKRDQLVQFEDSQLQQ